MASLRKMCSRHFPCISSSSCPELDGDSGPSANSSAKRNTTTIYVVYTVSVPSGRSSHVELEAACRTSTDADHVAGDVAGRHKAKRGHEFVTQTFDPNEPHIGEPYKPWTTVYANGDRVEVLIASVALV